MTSQSTLKTGSSSQTTALGFALGKSIKKGVFALFGDLGTGKTTFAKGLIAGFTGIPEDEINSPTFTILNIYGSGVCHFDLYRLKDSEEFLRRGFDEHLDGLAVIEWAERIESILPKDAVRITLKHAGEKQREITIR